MTASLVFQRLFADGDGESHLAALTVDTTTRDFAPPARPFDVSAFSTATRQGFLHLPADWSGDLHPSPIRMWIFLLTGEMEFTASDGNRCFLRPGSALLLEDTHGKGHVSRVIGQQAVSMAVVEVAE
ncbi:cupin domain-containing protein [Cupriavidus sp. RAF12]|uniref:cupin domain-containing protein n=1 Tax=Cupriavidus sp. RAF12 TaxID=3233050 RepID=UPI003F936308